MRTFICLLPLLCLAAPATLAQSSFKPGYIVQTSGDTLRGEVNDWEARRSKQTILFRATSQTAPSEYQPLMLRAYGLQNGSEYEVRATADGAAATGASSFLEIMERGPIRLYYLSDGNGRDSYYAAKATGPAVLLEKKMETVVLNPGEYNQQKVSRERNLYRAKLAELMTDCPDMGLYIAQLPFGEKSLRQAVRRYSSCRGSVETAPQPTLPRRTLQVGVVAGGGISQLQMMTNAFMNRSSQAIVTGGLALSMPFSRRPTRMSFVSGLLYEKGNYMNVGQASSFTGTQVKREYMTEAAFLRVPLGVRYGFKPRIIQPFAQLGFTAGYGLNVNVQYRDEYYLEPGRFYEWKKLEFAQRSFEQGMFAGIGLKTNYIGRRNGSVILQADMSNGFSESANPSTRFRRLYLLFTYDLNKQR